MALTKQWFMKNWVHGLQQGSLQFLYKIITCLIIVIALATACVSLTESDKVHTKQIDDEMNPTNDSQGELEPQPSLS